MPIARTPAGKLVYFAHVPKCAGTAVEFWMRRAFGQLAFHDPRFNMDPGTRWTRTSPQHVSRTDLDRLFPHGFFDASFAIVRHPVPRMVSVFRFQRDIEGRIDPDTTFSDWLEQVDPMAPNDLDNHTQLMDQIVPPEAQVFQLENGLTELQTWLETFLDGLDQSPGPILARNTLSERLKHMGKADRPVTPTPQDMALIASLYAADFERFGYGPEPEPKKAKETPA